MRPITSNIMAARALSFGAVVGLATVFSIACLPPAQAQSLPSITVMTDRAKVFRIDAPADTVIVGNPAIADVTMYDRHTVVVTGKMFGSTNLVILGKDAKPIIDEIITVRSSQTNVVTVQRNATRYSYSCAPDCEATIQPGDEKEAFDTLLKQIEAKNTMAQTAAGAPAQ